MDEDLPETGEPTLQPLAESDYKFDQPAQPQQAAEKDIVMLRSDRNEQQATPKAQQHSQQSVHELQRALKQTQLEIASRRERISLKRTELKSLSMQVEQQLQKAILAKSKHASLNLSDFFSKEGEAMQTENPRLAELRNQLKHVRIEQEKAKKELARLKQQQITRALGVDNEKLAQVKNKLKSRLQELSDLAQSKDTLQREVDMITVSSESFNAKETEEVAQKHLTIRNQLMRQVKEQKTQMNDIEREDRWNMEKIKFLLEASSHTQTVRRKNQSMDVTANQTAKAQRDKNLRLLAQEISEMLDEKYQVEGEIKQELERLRTQTDRLEKQNWSTINKLREYDAYLLNYYNTVKAHKRSINSTRREISMSRQEKDDKLEPTTKKNSQSLLRQLTIAEAETPALTELVEESQSIRIGPKPDSQSIVVTDFVENASIQELSLHYLSNVLVGIEAQYSTNLGEAQPGCKILSVPRNREAQTQSFSTADRVFRQIEVGFNSQTQTIGYFNIIDKDGESAATWGDSKGLQVERKVFPLQYKSINLSGTLRQDQQSAKNPNSWHLSGLQFRVQALISQQVKKVKSIASRRVRRIQQP